MILRPFFLRGNKGLTLVESLISIVLLGTLLVSVLGAFTISNLGASRARHRLAAMNVISGYMEQELRAGYDGGIGGEADYYETISSADPTPVTIDTRGTADTSDDLVGSLVPDPYFPDNVENADGTQITYNGVPFKIIGFVVTWNEDMNGQACSERAVCYVAYHTSS
ncbi:MAG: type II secretion system protein [Candidatus Omnitrophica bacterium]|nr:type II secretion system protein [Candidatus Omnitrophota bacterium]